MNYILVKVLCAEDEIDCKDVFKVFIETNLHRSVLWVNTATNLQPREKYLLLCKLESRAPDDVETNLMNLGLKSKISDQSQPISFLKSFSEKKGV